MNIHHAIALSLCHLRCGRAILAERFLNLILGAGAGELPEVQQLKKLISTYKEIEDNINEIYAMPLDLQCLFETLATLHSYIDNFMEQNPVFYATNESCMIDNLCTIYENYFGRRRSGVFVEVGAFDGRTQSNTDCLPPIGWSGLYIEPAPLYFEQCVRWHSSSPAIRFENCAAGAENGSIELTVGGVLSTVSTEVASRWREISWSARHFDGTKPVTVPLRKLDSILADHQVPIGFEILVVDTEGYEGEVFAGFNLEYWKPQIAIVELADKADQFAVLDKIAVDCKNIRERFIASGYQVIHADNTNTVFAQPQIR